MEKKASKTTFRKTYTSSGKLLVAGKNASQNEQLVKQVASEELVLHTKAPGSPFVNIKCQASEISKQDMKEAAIFCSRFSQAWKKAKTKKDIEVHYFKGKDVYKIKNMKLGTFGVKKLKKIIAKKDDIEEFEKNA
jgi:predicted ribosome quality control (RQC) complex YloA/Tae2 family protein